MSVSTLAGFLLASLAIELTPGPNMFYVAFVSAHSGRRAGLATIAGIGLGLLLVGVLALFGFAVFVANNGLLYESLRWGGVFYLVWLAYEAWRDAHQPPAATEPLTSKAQAFLRGFITNVLNPKAFLFYLTVLPSFVDAAGPYRPQAFWLTCLYVAVATLVHLAIVVSASSVAHLLEQPARRRAAGWVFAISLIAVAIWLAVKTAR